MAQWAAGCASLPYSYNPGWIFFLQQNIIQCKDTLQNIFSASLSNLRNSLHHIFFLSLDDIVRANGIGNAMSLPWVSRHLDPSLRNLSGSFITGSKQRNNTISYPLYTDLYCFFPLYNLTHCWLVTKDMKVIALTNEQWSEQQDHYYNFTFLHMY